MFKQVDVKIVEPSLPPHLEEVSLLKEEMEGVLLQGKTISNRKERLQIESSSLKSVVFESLHAEGSSLVSIIFDSCDLSNAKIGCSSVHQIVFKNCKLIGTDFSESSIQNVIFDTCDMSYSNFSLSKMRYVKIKDSKLMGSSFNEVKMQKIVLCESLFTECEFLHTSLKDIDFSGCSIEGMKTSYEDIKGIIVDERGALALASLLGIQIR